MNHVPIRNREVDRIREIVERHEFPDIVTGFEVRLDDFDGDPVTYVTFKTVGDVSDDIQERKRRSEKLRSLRERVFPDLLNASEDRYPHIRFEPANPNDP